MENNTTNSPKNSLHKRQFKDRAFTLQFIRTQVEKGTGKPLSQLKKQYSNIKRYKLALFYVTTTNKAVCEAMNVPVEAGTRYKDALEKSGMLVASIEKFICPYTKEKGVQFLSTNPDEFEKLKKSNNTQLNIWEGENG
jgi:hypothetical protein